MNECLQRMLEMGPILRRSTNDPLPFQLQHQNQNQHHHQYQLPQHPRSPLEQRLALPPSIRGLCAELQEVFRMSINETALPFPLKDNLNATAAASGAATGSNDNQRSKGKGSSIDHVNSPQQQQNDIDEHHYYELEATRRDRDSLAVSAMQHM